MPGHGGLATVANERNVSTMGLFAHVPGNCGASLSTERDIPSLLEDREAVLKLDRRDSVLE